ncbi:MAG: Rne/Rng family ribonuclease [Desulfobacterales bacterium]|nr:Rne/Rng family ribonuclease [Desulfobacterales bacterium]
MFKELVVNYAEHEARVALLENGTIVELYIERRDETSITGNIYKGRIQRVLPGMQAAFVDIGLDQAAFLYVDDIIDQTTLEMAKHFEVENGSDPNDDSKDETKPNLPETKESHDVNIGELIKEGQHVLVQVAKSPIGSKGPRVTTHLSFPGRYIVLMPYVDHIGISRKIDNEVERDRLRELILSARKNKYGYILRTAAEGIDADRLEKELTFLTKTWEDVKMRNQAKSASALIYRDLSITFRAVRDLLTDDANKFIIDSEQEYEKVQGFLRKYMPDINFSVELYKDKEPIFDAYNLEADIERALKKRVWLKSGGYIIIEQTEALVAIDVNTGRYVGGHNFEETVLKTNLEALKEIAYQVRLRNIGGIIIIDFIDMKKELHKEKVMVKLAEEMKKDKSQINILPLSELGLAQVTRQRTRKNLKRMLNEPCFYCGGDGMLLSGKSICYKIHRDLLHEINDMMGNKFTVKVHPEIARLFHGEEKHLINSLEKQFKNPIAIYPDTNYHMEEYHIFETLIKQ